MTWATGCGHIGRVAPFGGAAKLPFNVDWAAKWSHFGITIEGCGKDLGTKGGSRDRSDAISQQVFDREPPLNVHYEFLNVGGRKMSTSKGSGAAAHEMADLLPPELIRFLFLRHKPKKALDFDPGGDAIPGLFDEFDRLAAATAGLAYRGELPADHERIFRLSLVDPDADVELEARRFRPAFRHLTMLVQVPGVDLEARMAAEKGAPLDDAERAILAERADVARAWLDGWAPERYQVSVREDLPAEVAELSEVQGLFLGDLAAGAASEHPVGGDAWQDLIYRCGQARGVSSRDAFAAVYAAFLGRPNGPRAGWLLSSLDGPFVVERLGAAAASAREFSDSGRVGRGWTGRRGRMSVGPARLRDEADVIRAGCIAKREDPTLVDRALVIDGQRRELLGKADSLRNQKKQISESIGIAIKSGEQPDGPRVSQLKEQSNWIGAELAGLDAQLAEITSRLDELLLRIPNPPDADVPVGGEEASQIVRTWGDPAAHTVEQEGDAAAWVRKPHWEVAEPLGMIDLAAGAKVTGSGWPLYKGAGSKLQRSLVDFFLDLHTSEHGMTEVWPPVLVNEESARGTGQIPDKEDMMYVVNRDGLYLVPTAEVPVTNIHRDEIIEAEDSAHPLRGLLALLPA